MKTPEDALVGREHGLITHVRARVVAVKGVGVLHDEFAAAHQPEAGPDFVAEFGLNLIQINGQLAVRAHFAAHQVGDDFLMGGAHAVVAVVAVFKAQQFLAVKIPTARFLPQVGGLHGGHEHFLGAGAVHFLAHDLGGFVHRAQAKGQVGINARSQLADHAGAGEQLVADDLGVGRGLFKGR